MSLLVSALSSVLLSLFSLVIFAGPPAAPSPTSESPRTIEGLVTVNGEPAPAGIRVTVTLDDEGNTRCGDFVTAEGAVPFQLILPEACGPGSVALFQVDTGDRSETQVEITEDQRLFSTTVDFQLSAVTLASLGVPPDGTPEVVSVVPSSPLTGLDLFVVVVLTVVPATALLTLMVLKVGTKNGQRASVDESAEAARAAGNFRSQIEGMILVMVVLAVILLGVTDKIGSDGLVSVLAAIVGYTVGRHVTRGGT